MNGGNRSTIVIHVKLFLPQTSKHQSSWKHLQLDTPQLPTKTWSNRCLLNENRWLKTTWSSKKLLTQNSKLKRSCNDNKWHLKPCKRENKFLTFYFHFNSSATYSLTFIARDESRKITLKLAHLTKQNGQEKSSVTASKSSIWTKQRVKTSSINRG